MTQDISGKPTTIPWDPYIETFKLGMTGFIAAFVVALLLNVDQAVECLLVMAENLDQSHRRLRIILLLLFVIFLAWMLWYCGKTLQRAFLGKVESQLLTRIRPFIPQVIGVIPVIGLCIAFWRAAQLSTAGDGHVQLYLYVLTGVAALLAIGLMGVWTFLFERRLRKKPTVSLPPNYKYLVGISYLAALCCAIFFTFSSQSAQHFGALTIVVSAACVWVIVLHGLIYIGTKWHVPIFLILVGVVALWSGLDLNDDHQLRHSAVSRQVSHEKLETAFASWLNHRADKEAYGKKPYPVVLVATEGGGIYAAYHTALVLADLEDRNPAFAQHVFAISGVSGGSVGATLFATLVSNEMPVKSPALVRGRTTTHDGAENFFYPDFLSPLIAKTMYPDTFQQIVPFPLPGADRATALENSLEIAWTKLQMPTQTNPWSDDLDALWPDFATGVTPALMLNTTEVETGMQMVVSNLGAGQYGPHMFFDEHKSVHLPLSTATALSGRFPIITPAGLEPLEDGTERRYVDGGYFENSGMSTISIVTVDLLDLRKIAGFPEFKLVVLRIALDDSSTTQISASEASKVQKAAEVSFYKDSAAAFGEEGSPIRTMLNTRTAREETAIGEFHSMFDPSGSGNLFQFFLNQDKMRMPLGWLLSDRAKQEIERQVHEDPTAEHVLDQLKP